MKSRVKSSTISMVMISPPWVGGTTTVRNTLHRVISRVSIICIGSRPFVTTFSVAFTV